MGAVCLPRRTGPGHLRAAALAGTEPRRWVGVQGVTGSPVMKRSLLVHLQGPAGATFKSRSTCCVQGHESPPRSVSPSSPGWSSASVSPWVSLLQLHPLSVSASTQGTLETKGDRSPHSDTFQGPMCHSKDQISPQAHRRARCGPSAPRPPPRLFWSVLWQGQSPAVLEHSGSHLPWGLCIGSCLQRACGCCDPALPSSRAGSALPSLVLQPSLGGLTSSTGPRTFCGRAALSAPASQSAHPGLTAAPSVGRTRVCFHVQNVPAVPGGCSITHHQTTRDATRVSKLTSASCPPLFAGNNQVTWKWKEKLPESE